MASRGFLFGVAALDSPVVAVAFPMPFNPLMAATVNQAPLSFALRAQLYAQLSAMEAAGMTFDQALATLQLPTPAQPRMAAMRRLIKAGLDQADAGRRSGMFTPLEAALIDAARMAGSPAALYRRLSERCAKRAAQSAAIKSRMALPALMLILALFLQPLPALVGGAIGLSGYLAKALVPVILLAVALGFVRHLYWRLQSLSASDRPLQSKPSALAQWVAGMPLIGSAWQRRGARNFFESLGELLEAGVPMLQALPIAAGTVHCDPVRWSLAALSTRIEAGASFAQALAVIPFPQHEQACALALSGEASGALPQALLRHAAAESEAIAGFDQALAEWLPRLAYGAIVAWIAYGILRGGAFMPSVPSEL